MYVAIIVLRTHIHITRNAGKRQESQSKISFQLLVFDGPFVAIICNIGDDIDYSVLIIHNKG